PTFSSSLHKGGAHQKCGHLGEKATNRWAQDCGIVINLNIIKTVIAQCPVCQHTHTGKLPGQIWQTDYIGPLPAYRVCRYVCTAADTIWTLNSSSM
uniref:Integrase zinc-binding domain-containing protein n=1 Tax=Amazona collaria TaxID=241587 RepID=A0A8B9IUF7_9PSIT